MTGETVTCLTGIEPVSDYPRKVAHRRGNSMADWSSEIVPQIVP
jgi:hypothetical protein